MFTCSFCMDEFLHNWNILNAAQPQRRCCDLCVNCSFIFKWKFINFWTVKKKQLYSPFLWTGFSCLKAAEPLSRSSLLGLRHYIQNGKGPSSNPTRCSNGLWHSTLLQGPWWPLGWNQYPNAVNNSGLVRLPPQQ